MIIVIVHIKASLYLFLLSIINVSKRRGTTKKKTGSNKNRSLCIYAYTPLLNPEKRNGSSASSVCRSTSAVRFTIIEDSSCSCHETPA